MANTLSSRLDPTTLHMVSRDRVATVVHQLLNGANRERPPELVAAAAVLFYALAERSSLNPEELYHLGRKILTANDPHHDKPNVQLEALRDFAGLRVRTEPII